MRSNVQRCLGKKSLVYMLVVIVVGGVFVAQQAFADPPISLLDQQIEDLHLELERATSPEMRQSLEAKLGILERQRMLRVSTPPAPKDRSGSESTLQSEQEEQLPERTRDIFEDQPPFHSSEAIITNQWQDQVNGEWVHVYAGALPENPLQGMVIVLVEPIEATGTVESKPGGQYLTPTQSGAVTIVSAQGTLLTLETDHGKRFLFDAAVRAFVSH